jgi:hypothetical protein
LFAICAVFNRALASPKTQQQQQLDSKNLQTLIHLPAVEAKAKALLGVLL